jgi:hypothetical protein
MTAAATEKTFAVTVTLSFDKGDRVATIENLHDVTILEVPAIVEAIAASGLGKLSPAQKRGIEEVLAFAARRVGYRENPVDFDRIQVFDFSGTCRSVYVAFEVLDSQYRASKNRVLLGYFHGVSVGKRGSFRARTKNGKLRTGLAAVQGLRYFGD